MLRLIKDQRGIVHVGIILIALVGILGYGAISFSSALKNRVFNIFNPNSTKALTAHSPKVLLVIYNPIIESQGSQKLTTLKGWNDPDTLSQTLINDFTSGSNGLVNYTIAKRVEIDGYPVKTDGFQYTDDTYLTCAGSGGSQCHSPDTADYVKMLNFVNACYLKNSGQIDEVWLWGGPWFGYWESNLAGPNAFWYNSS